MDTLFSNDRITFNLKDAEIVYYPDFFTEQEANAFFEKLLTETPWQQDPITIFGKKHLQPRLTALFGNNEKPYSYSGITMQPHPYTELLLQIKSKVEHELNYNFTSVLLNLYRDGKDSNGWHADNEKELGRNPIIASVSFGAARNFQLKHNTDKSQKLNILLENGSLLLMKGSTQHHWKHQIPKTTKPLNPRINLTFRTIS
ncbi:alpha-ketoglutarate-dependent dioxygenase AlkB [Flavobacterium enshiense]|uniref:alpha-ketoglutarate-dependent dioxygenase AlkB family protein n=1 Tax=Flavobacterium enshiense TaxID=1341165 RepID=UPI00345CA5DE